MERDGEMIAGAVYERFNDANICMHLAGVPGRRWMTRAFLHAMFYYPFMQLGVGRITGEIEACNTDALRLGAHLGWHREAVLKDATLTGDLVIMVMWKTDWVRRQSNG